MWKAGGISLRLRFACALVAAVATVAASTPYFHYSLALVALVPFFVALREATWRATLLVGLLFGVVRAALLYQWTLPGLVALHRGMSAQVIGLSGLFLGYHAVRFAVIAAAVRYLSGARWRGGELGRNCVAVAMSAAAVWTLTEWALPQVVPSPVGAQLGYAAALRQSADIGGVYGLSWLVIFVNMLLAETLLRLLGERAHVVRPLLAAAAALSIVGVYGLSRLESVAASSGPLMMTVGVVQGAMAADVSQPDDANSLAWQTYSTLSKTLRMPAPGLVIWPESTLRVYLRQNPPFQSRLRRLVNELGHPLTVGALDRADRLGGELNSAYLFLPDESPASAQAIDRAPTVYHKLVLLPFAEYVPLASASRIFGRWPTTGHFVAGEREVLFSFDAGSGNAAEPQERGDDSSTVFAPSICFEAVMPGWFNRAVRDGAALLVNLTDDSWFGGTIGPALHLEATRLRAVETRRWLVRASNSGISAFIDPTGAIAASLPYGASGTLVHAVTLSEELTPYVRFGDWIVWLSLVICLMSLAARLRYARAQASRPLARAR